MTTDSSSRSETFSALVIGPYLVAHTLILSVVALLTWLAADWPQWFQLMPWLSAPSPTLLPEKFRAFQSVIVSACAAGLGGAVFMIREFYIKYAYGRDKKDGTKEFLQATEIPRFVLLPFSSVILGPVSYALAKTGAIAFAGISVAGEVPVFTAAALGFILGFAYHDTLGALRELSRRIFAAATSPAA